MTSTAGTPTPRTTGFRVAMLVIVWLAFAYVTAPSLGLYYERVAAWYMLPPLGLVFAYCISHRRRSTAILAVVATTVTLLLLGLSAAFPKGSAA